MGCFNPDPKYRSPSKEFTKTLDAYLEAAPRIYEMESAFSPLYTGLELSNLEATLFGTPGGTISQSTTVPTGKYRTEYVNGVLTQTPIMRQVPIEMEVAAQSGLLDMWEQAAPRMQELSSQARAADIADVAALGPEAMAAFRATNPQQAQLLDLLNQQAYEELQLGADLDPSLARTVQQSVRGAQAARGMGFGPTDVYEEAYATGLKAEQLRRARQMFAQQMVGVNAATTMDPFLAILGRPSQSTAAMGGLFAQGQGVQGGAGPGMFDPMNPYMQDLYNTNLNANAAAEIAHSNINAALAGSAIEGLGAIIGAAAMCWVAREVYGARNPRWRAFRHWLLTRSPAWFRQLYADHGEGFAAWLKDKPRIKNLVRRWMDRRIAGMNH